MLVLIAGLVLWTGAHLFKRLKPEQRAALGDKGRGVVALGILGGLVLMVIGYRMADTPELWGRTGAMTGINNLLMLLSVYLFAAAGTKTGLARKMRHPMLTAVKVWAFAHLLVNGDIASIILFGGLLGWAVAEVIMINRAEPDWTPPPPADKDKEKKTLIIAAVMFVLIVGIHYLLGYPTFG